MSGRYLRGLRLGLVCVVAAFLLARIPLAQALDQWLFDGCLHARGPRPTSAKVVLVGLDEATLNSLGKPLLSISPELSRVTGYLNARGAAAIGIDFIVPEELRDYPELQPGAAGDPTPFGTAVYEAGNVVLAQWRLSESWMRPLPQWQLKSLLDPAPTDLAFVNLTQDADQFVRRQRLAIETETSYTPSFALALCSIASGVPLVVEGHEVSLGGRVLPVDDEGRLPINFVGPPGTFPIVSFLDVLAAAESGGPLRDQAGRPVDLDEAIVVIGATAQTALDQHSTPYANDLIGRLTQNASGLMSGIEIHANLIATLLDGVFLRRLPGGWELLLLLGTGLLLGAVYSRLNLEKGLLVAVAYYFCWGWLCTWVFRQSHVRLAIVPMQLVGVLAYAGTFGIRWKRLRRMMGIVKSEAIAQALESDFSSMDLKGEVREVTVLFADIRNFTTFSEAHSPHEVVRLLNAYFGVIVPAIETHGGTLNTYMGDGIMVIFGAPVKIADAPRRAVEAAIAIVRAVEASRAQWAGLGCPDLRIGVGVHTGEVLVGTVGSANRLDYTAIGDAVNLAARVEAENKRHSTEILITEATYAQLPPELAAQCASTPIVTNVKGKHESVLVRSVSVSASG